MVSRIVFGSFLMLVGICVTIDAAEDRPPTVVSIINLIAAPEKFNERQIKVAGFAVVEFERHALYLSELDAMKGLSKNGVWLDFSSYRVNDPKMFNNTYVLVEGIFDMNMLGHGALYSGGIREISAMVRWR